MSGGSLNYAYSQVESIAYDLLRRGETNLHRAFAAHLMKCAKALHDVEWVFSCDYSPGDEVDAIRAVISRSDEVDQAKETARQLIAELNEFVES